ncbi:MAG: hypothetical protein KGY46_01620 [Anaerolineales bacterium]|nr:hypothetical protein [Anaerolineales bacterium]
MDISRRDWQLLSEYIDGELSERKRIRLESRLDSERGLRTALQSIKKTRRILRTAPRLSAPKEFVLTPDMLPRRQKESFFPVLRFATVLVSMLLVAVLVLDFGGFVSPLNRVEYAAPAMQQEALESDGDADKQNGGEQELEVAEEPQIMEKTEGVEREMAEGVEEPEEEAKALDVVEESPTPSSTAAPPTPTTPPPTQTLPPPIPEERKGLPVIRFIEIGLFSLVVILLLVRFLMKKVDGDVS